MADIDLRSAFYEVMFSGALYENTDDMMNMLEKQAHSNVIKIINCPEQLGAHIPPLPYLLLELIEELKKEETDFKLVSAIIERDPSLALRVLRIVNSPKYLNETKSEQSDNLQGAIGRVGLDGISSIACTLMMEDIRPQKPIYFKMFGKQIWIHSLHCAYLCKGYAQAMGEDGFSGHFLGLIHDIGKIIIFDCLTEALSSGIMCDQPGSKIFIDTMSEMSMNISSFVAKAWKLPNIYRIALEQQRSTPDSVLAKSLYLANTGAELYLLYQKKRITKEQLSQQITENQCHGTLWDTFLQHAPDIDNQVY